MKRNLPLEILKKDKIKDIIECINKAELQYKFHVIDEGFVTENGKYHEIWNYIFKNINQSFNSYPYKCYRIDRGNLWQLLAIYNEEDCILYIVMKEERFKDIQKDSDNEYHYVKVLNSINNYLQKDKYEQITFIDDIEDKESYIKDDLEKMLGDINGKVDVCVDILFSERYNRVTKISGNVCDYNLRLIKNYSWNEYIQADINEIIDTNEEYTVENPPIELPIKKHVQSKSKHGKEDNKNEEEMLASKDRKRKIK